jgi:hypothetical protein
MELDQDEALSAPLTIGRCRVPVPGGGSVVSAGSGVAASSVHPAAHSKRARSSPARASVRTSPPARVAGKRGVSEIVTRMTTRVCSQGLDRRHGRRPRAVCR